MQTALSSRQDSHVSVADLNRLAVRGLATMYDDRTRLFCFRMKRTHAGVVREGVCRRYTMMALLGLSRVQTSETHHSSIHIPHVFNRLLKDPGLPRGLGDLGLLLWLSAMVAPARFARVYAEFEATSALARAVGARHGVTMQLAWFLTGLSHAALAGIRVAGLEDQARHTWHMLVRNQSTHGLFGHCARTRTLQGRMRGRIGSFADQVYPIYALTRFAQAFDEPAALAQATSCADAICQAQGPMGQWWWHYDASTGHVFQRYPVYAVHQEGMAPMALFALGEATGRDFGGAIGNGLAWIGGANELRRDLRDDASSVVWRDIARRNALRAYARELWGYLRSDGGAVSADDLSLNCECRPYELGWLLYAYAGRERDGR